MERLTAEAGSAQDDLDATAVENFMNAENISLFAGTEFLRFPRSISGLVMLVDTAKALGKSVTVVPLLDRNNQRGAWDMGVLPGSGRAYASKRQRGA